MEILRMRVTFFEDVLGTQSNNPDIHEEFIASKAPDAKSREEEIAAIGVDAEVEKSMTVFPKDENGNAFFWDYQIKGFFKGACSMLRRCKGESFAKESNKMAAFKKVIDGCIFPAPRKIMIRGAEGEIGSCQRPLRAQTAQGERISLANSESITAKSSIEFNVVCLSDAYADAVKEWMDYGVYSGLGQWRNSGKGRFVWELLDSDGNVVGGNAEAMRVAGLI